MHIIWNARCGNGYRCGCCSRTSYESGDFGAQTAHEAREELLRIFAENYKYDEDWDFTEIKIVGHETAVLDFDEDDINAEGVRRYEKAKKIKALKEEKEEIVEEISRHDRNFLSAIQKAEQDLAEELITQKGFDKIQNEEGDAYNNATAPLINRRTRISEELEALGV